MSSSPWFNCISHQPGAKLRLLCFPWCSGGSQVYAKWGKLFPANIEVVGVRLPGREQRVKEPFMTDLSAVCKKIAAEIYSLYSDKPLALFGHSMGCSLCFETASILKDRYRREPVHVFFSSEFAPHSEGRKRRLDEFSSIVKMNDSQLIDRIALQGGTPSSLLENMDFMTKNVLPVYRADLQLVAHYHRKTGGRKPLSCAVTCFEGTQDKQHDMEDYAELTSGQFIKKDITGGHFYFFEEENFETIKNCIVSNLLETKAKCG